MKLHPIVRALFKGYKEARPERGIPHLDQDHWLYNSQEMNEMIQHANEKELEEIKDYLERFEQKYEIFDVDSYAYLYIEVNDKIHKSKTSARMQQKRMATKAAMVAGLRRNRHA